MRRPLLMMSLVLLAAGCAATADDAPIDDGEQALSTDCSTTRPVVCHDSPNNCSYAAKKCDPVPRALDRASRTSSFALAGSGHAVEDSLGDVIGYTTAGSVHLNW